MKTYPGINYRQRPKSYWTDGDPLALILRDVKGTLRRQMIRDHWEQGRIEELSGDLLQGTLPDYLRQGLGRIHPTFLGGEFLPDFAADEVEIVRIELQSTTADVISIRARRDPEGIRYRIVDEYESEFTLARETSRQPLTLQEMIDFIEGSEQEEHFGGLALCFNDANAEDGPRDHLRHFTRISSLFYPELEAHFEQVFEEWVREAGAEDGSQSEGASGQRAEDGREE